jgi:hypothetical protein
MKFSIAAVITQTYLWPLFEASPDLDLLLLVSLELFWFLALEEPIEEESLLVDSFSLLPEFLVLGMTLKFNVYSINFNYILSHKTSSIMIVSKK